MTTATLPNPAAIERAGIMQKALNAAFCNRLGYLAGRWADEREYEDFATYDTALREAALAAFPPGSTVVRTSKRPFGITLRVPGFPYDCLVSANSRTLGWKSVPRKG